MTRELSPLLGFHATPQADRTIVPPAGKHAPVRPETHRPDRTGMASELSQLIAFSDTPQADRTIIATAGKHAAVRPESYSPDCSGTSRGFGHPVLAFDV